MNGVGAPPTPTVMAYPGPFLFRPPVRNSHDSRPRSPLALRQHPHCRGRLDLPTNPTLWELILSALPLA